MAFDFAPGRVCVLLPSYRHARYLPKRIDSILGQSYADFGLTVIDDKSPDETAQILDKYRDRGNFKAYIRNENSGSPFAAWEDAAASADAEYLWIAESDDFASKDFLANAVAQMDANPNSVLYYTHSWVVDESNLITGHTLNYLKEMFPKIDWSVDQKICGESYNSEAQIYGNAVPNMSSALIRLPAFRSAMRSDFRRYKLAADWTFIGRLAAQGDVEFRARSDNYFRKHSQTARAETRLEATCAEYSRAISVIGSLPGVNRSAARESILKCFTMFVWEGGKVGAFAKESMRFGVSHNFTLGMRVLWLILRNPQLLNKLRELVARRRQHVAAS